MTKLVYMYRRKIEVSIKIAFYVPRLSHAARNEEDNCNVIGLFAVVL